MANKGVYILLLVLAFISPACKKNSDTPEPDKIDIVITQTGTGSYQFKAVSNFEIDYFFWEFDDGSIPGFEPEVEHKYNNKGIYNIRLVANGENGFIEKSKELKVDAISLPSEISITGIEIIKSTLDTWDNDGTAPDVFFAVHEESHLLHKTIPVLNLTSGFLPAIIAEPNALKLNSWSSQYTVGIYDDNGTAPPKLIHKLTFIPENYKEGVKPYPGNIWFANDSMQGYLYFSYQ